MQTEEKWATGQTTQDGKPMTVRLSLVLYAVAPIPLFPIEITISATYAKPDSSGMPVPADAEELAAFEAFAVEALAEDDLAKLAAVVTFDGMRDYFFYSRNDPKVAERLKRIVDHRGGGTTGASAQEDPGWATLRAFGEGIVGS